SSILRQETHLPRLADRDTAAPSIVTTQSKFNPLQQVAYVGVMYGLLPLLLLTGLLCLYPQAVGDVFPGV
ncbi:hypothetical protein ACUOFC_68670, partial [Escherichia sp. TWPC-MK]